MNYFLFLFLDPESVGEIMAPKITDTEITLTWNIPDGDKDGYEVQYQDHEGNLIKNVTILNRISYSGLRPHHNYTFLVSVLSGYDTSTTIRGRPISRTFHTLESGIPSPKSTIENSYKIFF
ncbi:tyrosine-protein phosphatase 10D [Trichonephila clavipes]|nr:tyrosine-protein phosphatase 10D [Trichonephila clavipes]